MAFQKKVTKGVFEAVKILLQGGASVKEICKYLNLSDYTIYVIKNVETYEEYEQHVAEKIAKSNAARAIKQKQAQENKSEAPVETKAATQVVEHRQTVVVQATHYMMEEMKKTNELLTTISAKLAFIVDELTGVKSNG